MKICKLCSEEITEGQQYSAHNEGQAHSTCIQLFERWAAMSDTEQQRLLTVMNHFANALGEQHANM